MIQDVFVAQLLKYALQVCSVIAHPVIPPFRHSLGEGDDQSDEINLEPDRLGCNAQLMRKK